MRAALSRLSRLAIARRFHPTVFRPTRLQTLASASYSASAMSHQAKTESETPYFQYYVLEGVERLEHYCPGGYHPVLLGDRFDNRYRIVHKLGFGGSSTIWLARDERANTYVAVKILVADYENPTETEIFRLFDWRREKSRSEINFVPPLLDEFNIEGPNGTHRCIVTPLARCSIDRAQDVSSRNVFKLPVARAIAAQLINAVAFLHSQGIVHADLHRKNILLRLTEKLDDLTPGQLIEKYAFSEPEPVQRVDKKPLGPGVPTHGVMPLWLGAGSDKITLPEARILLADFGESFMPSVTQRLVSGTPMQYRPPEVYFLSHEPISFPADIWTLACTIFSILGYRLLFNVIFATWDTMIEDHIEALGELPPGWWDKWEKRGGSSFDERGQRPPTSIP